MRGAADNSKEECAIINGRDTVILDFQGQAIRFPYERWLHILSSHPNMVDMRETIGETLRDPDIVIRSNSAPERARIYQKWMVGTIQGDKWVRVIVRFFADGDAFVLTAFTRNLMETGETLWRKGDK